MAIIISKNKENAVKIDRSEIDLEENIQEYIYNNPNVIPLYEINDDIKLFVAAREFIPDYEKRERIDGLAFDETGNIYVIETKLYKNADKRNVVAQALDYGAQLWRCTTNFNDFLMNLNDHTQKQFRMSFEEKYKDFFNIDDASDNMATIADNLNTGNIKFIILMDKLHASLKDLIIYINQNSKFDIYAVELEYYKHQEYEIIIPKLFGNEVKKSISSNKYSPKYETISEQEFNNILNSEQSLSAENIKLLFKLKENYNELIKKYNGSSYIYRSSYGPSGYGIHDSDQKVVLLISPTEGIWFYQKDRTGKIAELNRNILNRLIKENILDKTEKNLSATQWSVKASFWKSKDKKIITWLNKFMDIVEEEIKRFTER